ncbi:MAG TPA: hypothetical protein VGK99_23050, partial [Acidobacteriota bacterium]
WPTAQRSGAVGTGTFYSIKPAVFLGRATAVDSLEKRERTRIKRIVGAAAVARLKKRAGFIL